MADSISTGGGPAVGGNVGTGGGDFVGGAKQYVNETIVNVDQITIQKILIELEFLKRDVADVCDHVSDVKTDIKLVQDRQAYTIEEIDELKRSVDPRWLRGFMVVLAFVLIVLLVFFSYKVL